MILIYRHLMQVHRRSQYEVNRGTRLGKILSNTVVADYRRNLGRIGKMGTLSILQSCPRPSQTIGNIYNF